MKNEKIRLIIVLGLICLCFVMFLWIKANSADVRLPEREEPSSHVSSGEIEASIIEESKEESDVLLRRYQDYRQRLDSIEKESDISENSFQVIEEQVFPITLKNLGEVSFIPALDEQYHRLVIFLAKKDGSIIFRTDQLESNNQNQGELEQPNKGIAAVSFQDMNGDELTDIVLITLCARERSSELQSGDSKGGGLTSAASAGEGRENGSSEERTYKVGDVLFQNPSLKEEERLYRDYRLSDKINRYSMNKSIKFITSFIIKGYSTEFLYTATTLDQLLEQGFGISSELSYFVNFEKQGKLLIVPGTYTMAEYSVFMIYLVNEQGYIVWSFQPMGDYENLYGLKGIACTDVDGDGLRDMAVLADFSFEGTKGETIIKTDYLIYYQRTNGFYEEGFPRTQLGNQGERAVSGIKSVYQCSDSDTMEMVVENARAYWGWKAEK